MVARADAAPRLRASRRRYGEVVVRVLLGVCALISVATTIGIIAALFLPAFEVFADVSLRELLTGTEWAPHFEPPLVGGVVRAQVVAAHPIFVGGVAQPPLTHGQPLLYYRGRYARLADSAPGA